jgi:predicted RecB family nuclease
MITDRTFLSFLDCRRKAFLQTAGSAGEQPDIERVQFDLDALYRRRALEAFLGACQPSDVVRDPTSWAAVRGAPRVIVNVTVGDFDLQAQLHAAEQIEGQGGRGAATYAPVLFVRTNHLTRSDKLLLVFQALALASVQGAIPPVAKLVHGDGQKVLKLKVEPLLGEVRQLVTQLRAAQAEPSAPRVTLNGHCSACKFRAACRQAAERADDLSLLRGMPAKEVEKHRSRGVTTVTQFSHTYRPGRRGKRLSGKARRHDHALQALAIRETKVYVLDSPAIPQGGVAVYLDVEGIPDRGFEYLIGLLAVKDGVCTEYSFWADDPGQERAIWADCLRVLEAFGDYTLYHYGGYESRFLDRMKRSAASGEDAAAIERIQARSCNVLAAIYSHVYFPTWSNGLKDVGSFLGARWSAADASGVQSMAWRLAWESNRDTATRQLLVAYNREDCLALQRVTEFVRSLGGDQAARTNPGGPAVASVQDIQPAGKYQSGKTEFFCPELAQINKCAYSDYQRDKVYLRTSPAMRRSLRRKQQAAGKRPKVNEEIECGKPDVCPACGSREVRDSGRRRYHLDVSDLKYTSSGVKRWLVRYTSLRYHCGTCRKTFYADAYRSSRIRLGNNLASWVMYHHVALRQTYEDVNSSLNDIFGFAFTHTVLGRVKPWMAERHQATYERMKEKLRRGTLIHGDETKVLVKSHAGYVWAFTNLEEVVYTYTPTREGTILEEMLKGFDGVLVSDFYAAYDSPKCKQQKCVIHLMRDINDDIFHNPFDEELKQLAQKLVGVLKPIIDTIDRYGLKQYHLNKHKEEVARYFRYLSEQAFGSEVASKYQKRLQKYQDKLFVFLDHDGIPWNNNNAENAIKRFASRRKIFGTWPTADGLQDYLVFLSIYQTCRLKNLSFLRFLRSGTFDIDAFAEARGQEAINRNYPSLALHPSAIPVPVDEFSTAHENSA